MSLPRLLTVLLAGGLAMGASGCMVRVYQPVAGLQSPVVVDLQAENLDGVRLLVHCVPRDALSFQEAAKLCANVSTLFENQGATVRTVSTVNLVEDDLDALPADEAPPDVEPIDLRVVLSARTLHTSHHPVQRLLCIASFTLVPAVTETTFAQDVEIRDGTGFLLARDSFEGRLVSYFGVGMWAANKIVDIAWREDEDKLTLETLKRDLSTDLYRQLSQLVFNAKIQWQVLQERGAVSAVE